MKIYEGLDSFKRLDYGVVTSGTFDGVHVGHQAILQRVSDLSRSFGGNSVLLTFWPHPRFVLNNETNLLRLLNTIDEKESILEQYGIEYLIKIPFTREFAQTSSEDFIRNLLVQKIGTKRLVIGYNHRFGRNREGSFSGLVQNAHLYGFEVEEIPKHEVDHVGISSTIIRQALNEGDIDTANSYLGRPYMLSGSVVQGEKLGRKIGYPTANLDIPENYKLVPCDGTYAVWVLYQNIRYRGMMNIGMRPTVNGRSHRIEVHILEFDRDIYGENLTVNFIKRIRDEKKFDSIGSLKIQLDADRETVNKLLL
jgi:riboflavin kinase/FMN adenylyltransferase